MPYPKRVRFAAAFLIVVSSGVTRAEEPVRLTVLHTNDLHGQLDPLPPSPVRAVLRGKPAGGFAHLAAMVKAIRREERPTLLLDAGDLFQGTPVGNETRGDAVIDALNALHYDAAAVGNHEFDFGVKNLARLVKRARFPMLAANLSGRGLGMIRPYVVFAPPKVPCRIVVVGLITPDTPSVTTADLSGNVKFSRPARVLKAIVREAEADLVFVVSHLGHKADIALAKTVPQVALIVGGHTHTPFGKRVGDTWIVQTHARGISLGRVDLELRRNPWRIEKARLRLLAVDPRATPADPKMQSVIDGHARGLRERLARVVGRLAAPARRSPGLGSSTAGNWLADVLRRAGKADIGIMNKGGIRCDLEAGPVTAGDCYRLMPFDNTVVVLEMTGADLLALAKRHFAFGGYPALEWSGLKMTARQRGKRVILEEITVADKALDNERVYKVATNSFLSRGGDGFGRFAKAKRRTDTRQSMRDAIAADLAAHSPVRPPEEQRVQIKDSRPARQGR